MKLHGGLLVGRRDEGWGRGVERETGGDGLGLLGRRGLRRVAGQGGALRRAVDGVHVAIGQQAGAEFHVVLEVEGAASLELCAESVDGG